MDLERPAVALCIEGTRAEFERRLDDARRCYAEAWRVASDAYERCVAAHYVAHLETDPVEALRWNRISLAHAHGAAPDMVATFFPSLYLSLGRSYEVIGDVANARECYALAASWNRP
jgi:hypothetical protein